MLMGIRYMILLNSAVACCSVINVVQRLWVVSTHTHKFHIMQSYHIMYISTRCWMIISLLRVELAFDNCLSPEPVVVPESLCFDWVSISRSTAFRSTLNRTANQQPGEFEALCEPLAFEFRFVEVSPKVAQDAPSGLLRDSGQTLRWLSK